MAETEGYGLISGPSWLRQSLVADVENMGCVRNPYDKCIMTLPAQPMNAKKDGGSTNRSSVNEGIVFIEVEDILEGGSPIHREKMDSVYQPWKCGTCTNLKKERKYATMFSEIRVIQN